MPDEAADTRIKRRDEESRYRSVELLDLGLRLTFRWNGQSPSTIDVQPFVVGSPWEVRQSWSSTPAAIAAINAEWQRFTEECLYDRSEPPHA